MFFCGGDCAEDLGGNFKYSLSNNPNLKPPSPDRILNSVEELANKPVAYASSRSRALHTFAVNKRLNALNLSIIKKLFSKELQHVTVDCDNTICYTKKKDSSMTYKHEFGYQPGVAFINNHVAYVENRSGRSNPRTGQHESLNRLFNLLKEHDIKVNQFRADSGSFTKSVVDVVNEFANTFYLRARMSHPLEKAIGKIENWTPLCFNGKQVFSGETIFTPFQRAARGTKEAHKLKTYRLIVTKEKRRAGQIKAFTGEAYLCAAIMTNDHEMTADEVVIFYNQRGATEKEFDIFKNDFGWNKLPFSHIHQNNAYLIITAICRNLYAHLIKHFSRKTPILQPLYRIKKFIFRFVCIPAKWIKHAGQWQ